MHIKDLKKLQAQVKRLEELDKEIIHIEQYGTRIKDKSLSLQLELSHSRPNAPKVEFDEDGSIINIRPYLQGLLMPQSFIEFGTGSRKEEKRDSCKLEISEVIGLEVLGVMVAHKHAERMVIVKKLQDAGFEVSI